MTTFVTTLRIDKVGDREAIRALDDLNAKGRKVVEDAASALKKGMGEVAVAYQQGSAKMKAALEDVAAGHRATITEMAKQESAAERLSERNAHAMASASRGIEMLGRTGQLTGRSLDAVVGQVSQMAFMFGPAGQIVTAVGISTAAIVEMFMRTSREAKKAADEAVQNFARIAHMDVAGQGREAQLLYNGDRFSANPMERFGMQNMRQQAAALQARIAAGTSTFVGAYGITTKSLTDDARQATDDLRKLNAELTRRSELLASITGPGGSLEYAGTLEKVMGAPDEKVRKPAIDKAAKQLAADLKAAFKLARDQMVETAQLSYDAGHAYLDGLIPSKKEIDAAVKQAGQNVKDAIANDPFLAGRAEFAKQVKLLARDMERQLRQTLGDGLSAGFEAAFSGKGITGAFEALTATVLAGLGGFMEQLGAQMIVIGLSLDLLAEALLSLDGPAAIAAGVALVAAGAGLKAIAGSFGHSSGSSSYAGGASSQPAAPDFLSFGVRSSQPSMSVSTPSAAMPPMSFTIIGANDPTAQRAIGSIVDKAFNRGLMPSLAGARR